MISFGHPIYLFGLLLVPLAILWHWQATQREHRALNDFLGPAVQGKIGVFPRADLRFRQGILLIVASVFSLVALSKPHWGATPAPERPTWFKQNLVVVFDASKSMRAMDADGVSRYERAAGALSELLESSPGWRWGLVAYAGQAEVFCPLTTDRRAVKTLLARARPGSVSGRGSDLESGLKAALPLFFEQGEHHILVVSDGESHTGDALAVLAEAKQQGIRIHTLLCGSEQGAPVPGEPDVWGNPTFIEFSGEQVISRPQAEPLAKLARAGRGEFFKLEDADIRAQLLRALPSINPGLPSDGDAGRDAPPFQPFQGLLLLALGCLLLECWLALSKQRPPLGQFPDILRQTIQRQAVFIWPLIAVFTLSGWTWYPHWLLNEQAIEAMAMAETARAESLWREALRHNPQNPRLNYNLACALYARGAYPEAEALLERALKRAPVRLRPDMRYNLGNARFRLAERSGDQRFYEKALSDYEAVLAERPNDPDALHNVAVVRDRLKQSKQSQMGSHPRKGQTGRSARKGSTPIGVQTQYRPPPPQALPSNAEVDAALNALENDEQRRQTELLPPQPVSRADLPDPRRIIEQALQGLELDKDW